jgi:hypothetical protein
MLMGELGRNRHYVVPPAQQGTGLSDPLQIVQAIAQLVQSGRDQGYEFITSSDFTEFGAWRRKLRASQPSPMFDVTLDRSLEKNSFWMGGFVSSGECISLQAFRLDEATPNLASWVIGWMMGLYARRQELIVPKRPTPPQHSLTTSISGPVAYHGELWIERHHRKCFELFSRVGLLLALIKWQPSAIWALIGEAMATRGHMVRMGYGHLEPSFLTWEWCPEGAEPREWVGIAERRHLEFSVAELAATAAKHQL